MRRVDVSKVDFEHCNLFQLPNATFDAVSYKNAARICNFFYENGNFEKN